MNILILGGGSCQLNAVKRCKDRGCKVVVADYLENAPGKKYADHSDMASTFDGEDCLKVALKYSVDGVFTLGTDQPVYTAAYVADKLGLPFFIDIDTAKAVTNKKVMKDIFIKNNIPTIKYKILKEDFSCDDINGLKPPFVIKPLDSQGQRGVYKVNDINGIREHMEEVLSFSREKEILAEEFYESDEITVSGWVKQGQPHILTVTDRVTFSRGKHIGICAAHRYPSKYLKERFEEIKDITNRITEAFGIKEGPIYYQMLIGDQGVLVNEIACRIGGAYEDIFIPHITAVPVLDMLIDGSLGLEIDYSLLDRYDILKSNSYLAVYMLFIKPGKIGLMTRMEEILSLPGVIGGSYNFAEGDCIGEISDARFRAGAVIISGKDEEEYIHNVKNALDHIKIKDEKGRDLLIRFEGVQ